LVNTIILPVVLYGCETWSLTLREERRLRVFENRALKRVFGPKRDEVTGEWRKLHNEELNNQYSSPSIVRVVKSRRMRWAGHVARMREERGVRRVLVGKPEGKRPLGRPRRRWEDNIKMDSQLSHVLGLPPPCGRVTAVLRSIPKEAFADSFQKLYERCQPCVGKDGEYFEGQ
jgi:hypothetical protein